MNTPKPNDGETVYLPGPKVRERYGRTDMTIHRWLNDPEMGFPRPHYFGRFRYWRIDELEAWERAQAVKAGGKYSHAAVGA
jgi:hypothetical protein